MRSKLLLLVLLPTFVYSQSYLTDGEQEKRIAHVSKFCSLLSRWSNGERTLDTQIYNLCSGSNCTAYDEVTTKKETTLRNYLLGIQKNYPQKFSMEISKPSERDVVAYKDGYMGIKIKNDFLKLDETIGYEVDPWPESPKFLAYKVNQKTPLGTMTKYVLYDLNTNKITGYIAGEGTQASYLEAIYLLNKTGDYRSAINKFQTAASNKRATFGKSSNFYTAVLNASIGNYDSAIDIADKNGFSYYSSFFKGERLFMQRKYKEAIAFFKECEIIEKNSISNNTYIENNDSVNLNIEDKRPYLHYCIGLAYLLDGNNNLGGRFLEQASEEGFLEAEYCIYKYCIQTSKLNVSFDQAIARLFKLARKGYNLAQFEYGVYKEYFEKKKQEAIYWYYEANKNSIYHPLSKACLGKLCVKMKSGLPYLGYRYLSESLKESKYNQLNNVEIGFQLYLEGYKPRLNLLSNGQFWIKSKSDVQMLINQYSNYAPFLSDENNDSGMADSIYHENDENWDKANSESNRMYSWYMQFKKNNPGKVVTY